MLSVIILIRKRTLIFLGCLSICLIGFFSLALTHRTSSMIPVFAAEREDPVITIIDAGHGGEDGGAVSSIDQNVCESHLNLAISLRMNDLLRFTGQPTLMTRTEDLSIHTEGDTIRARKASDIRNRVTLVNETTGAVLLSIHQNSLPSSPVTHGAQVFWNHQNGSELLARLIQDSLNQTINPENPKQPRQIPKTIYLMNHVNTPAVLVECGFLSNGEETLKLQEPSYQIKLAAAIATGYLRCMSGEEVS